MNEDMPRASIALKFGYAVILVVNTLLALSGILLVALIYSELKKVGGERWGLLLVLPWSIGGMLLSLPILIVSFVYVAYVNGKVKPLARWILLFLILLGTIFHAAPFLPEFQPLTVPLVDFFD